MVKLLQLLSYTQYPHLDPSLAFFCGKSPSDPKEIVDDSFWVPHNLDDPNYNMPRTPWAYEVLDRTGTEMLLKLASTVKKMIKQELIDYEVAYGEAYKLHLENAKTYKQWYEHRQGLTSEPAHAMTTPAQMPRASGSSALPQTLSEIVSLVSPTSNPIGSLTPTGYTGTCSRRAFANSAREKLTHGAEMERTIPESDELVSEYGSRTGEREKVNICDSGV